MAGTPNEKWTIAASELEPDLRQMLLQFKQDYEAASKIHVPNYKGGPNPGILAELIRMGWRKAS